MNASERPMFGASEVIQITSKFEAEDDAFIIGGQATNFWAWFYKEREPRLGELGPFTSEDIDYFGSKDVAAHIAEALGGELLLAQARRSHGKHRSDRHQDQRQEFNY
jgi:hypothetical protein